MKTAAKQRPPIKQTQPTVSIVEKEIKPLWPWRPYQMRFINDPAMKKIWVKSAQIGGSTTVAGIATGLCIKKPRELVVVLSASERQAKEVGEKAAGFIRALGGVDASLSQNFFEDTSILVHTISFPQGSRIIVLPANPDTARGYTGHVILDEFGHTQKDEEVFKVAYRQVTLDYQMLVISTPNRQQGKFYKMARALSLDQGKAPDGQPVVKGPWSGHWTDIHLAVREGLRVNIEGIREGCDGDTWAQEYCCQFLSESSLWIPPELIESNVSPEANMGPPALFRSNLYAGWDIARNGHHSTIWFNEMLGDVSWCRGVVNVSGMDTPTQLKQARAWLPQVYRMNVDMTGMGMTIAETLMQDYPGKVEGVTFTAAIKEQMAVHTRMRLEQRKMRLPNDEGVRRSFLSLRRSTNKIGQARFDADADEKYGHADEFWACSLAEMAAQGVVSQHERQGHSSIMFDRQTKSPLGGLMTRPL